MDKLNNAVGSYSGPMCSSTPNSSMPINSLGTMPKGPSEIDQELAGVHVRISELEAVISGLENKLGPILSPDSEKDGGTGLRAPRSTMIGNSLADANTALDYRLNRLGSIIRRIEL